MIPILKSCTADWNKMESNVNGRFCTHCKQIVHDFTQMSDNEVLDMIQRSSSTGLCGRVKQTKWTFSKPITITAEWKVFLVALVMTFFSAGSIFAQPPFEKKQPIIEQKISYKTTVKGKVFAHDNKTVIESAKVRVTNKLGETLGETTTDKKGKYTCTFTINAEKQEVNVYFESSSGYSTKSLTVKHKSTTLLDATVVEYIELGAMVDEN